jgi:predicted ATPase
MKLQGQSKQELIDVVAAGLKKGRQLLIFDNCETALEECADIVAKLLKECPDLHVVLTSRMDLGALFEIGVEHVYRVPPMQSPDPDRLPDLKTLEEMDSVELLLERVRARKGEFGLTSANAPKIARLCRGLDGIPLALELVAAQLEDLSVDEVLEQSAEWLDYRGVVAGSQEHQVATLRNTIRLSYDLLGRDSSGEVARRLFRNLGVFHRGWTIEAALAVCGGAEQSKRDLQDLLKTLRHASLIEMETVRQEDRYRYLDPIREFALDELKAAGQEEALEGRHAQWAMGYAESWSPKLLGEESEVALMKLVGEADNLRGAIFWAKDRSDTEMTLRLTTALWRVFEIRALYREGGRRLEMALGMPGADKFPKLQAMAYGGLTMFAYRLGDLVTAESDAQKGLDLAQAAAYVAGVANAWNDFGIIANSRGEYQKALEFYSRSLELEKKELNQRGIAVGTYNCGRQAYNVGRLDDAERDIQTSCDMFLKAGNKREAAFALNSLSLVVRLKGRREEALGYVEESLKIRREFEDKRGVAEALRTKAGILIDQTDLAEAQKLLDESGSIVASIGDDRGSAETLEFMAWLSRARGLANETAILYATADQQRSKLKLPLPPVEKPLQDANLDFARKELGESSFKAEWEKGRRTSYEDALGLTANQKGEAVQPI